MPDKQCISVPTAIIHLTACELTARDVLTFVPAGWSEKSHFYLCIDLPIDIADWVQPKTV